MPVLEFLISGIVIVIASALMIISEPRVTLFLRIWETVIRPAWFRFDHRRWTNIFMASVFLAFGIFTLVMVAVYVSLPPSPGP